jgi:beta-galactosidase
MNISKGMTRREAIQGILGTAVISATPSPTLAKSTKSASHTAWPIELVETSGRLRPLNESWQFFRGEAEGAWKEDFDDTAWRRLDIPHDWSIEDLVAEPESSSGAIWAPESKPLRTGPFDLYASQGQTATGWTVGGTGWYRKTFDKPDISSHGKVELRFEGVYMNAEVWINGVQFGIHPYGYTEFAYDITKHLKDGKNCIAVQVKNTGRNSRWYAGSGIYRDVSLKVSGEISIPAHGVYLTTREATAVAANTIVQTTVENRAATDKQVVVRVRFVDGQNIASDESAQRVTVPGNSSAIAECSISLENPRLWSPDTPHLYRVQVIVQEQTQLADSISIDFGLRTIQIDAAEGLRINGETVKLRGGCVHSDNGPLGSACFPRAEERRLEILKANGYNAVRTSHNPPSRSFLDACDRLGMLVIDEAFDCWEQAKNSDDYHLYFKDWWQRDLESMILRDRNHPSVILWSIGNEMRERAEPQGVEIGKQLAALVHRLDPSRMVTAAICEPYDHPKLTWDDMQPAFTYLDVAGYNYRLDKYESDHTKYPERVMVGTESFPGMTYENWDFIEKAKWVIGDFVWTAADYIGESGLGSLAIRSGPGRTIGLQGYPWFNSYCGDIDLIGNKKPQSYFRDVVWRRSKVEMAVQRPIPEGWSERLGDWSWSDELRSWSWPGFEGTALKVRVYTRAAHVKLFLNGELVGSKDLSQSDALKAEFSVPYHPGELKAVIYEANSEIGSITFATAGRPRTLILSPDRRRLSVNKNDPSYVMVQVADEAGHTVPDAIVPVSISIEGVGELIGIANANPKDVASFRQPHRDTFHGACLAVVRSAGKPGRITVRAQSPGLLAASTELESTSN